MYNIYPTVLITLYLNVTIDRKLEHERARTFGIFPPQRNSIIKSKQAQRKSNNENTAGAPVQLFN